jgi:hypothetical protein
MLETTKVASSKPMREIALSHDVDHSTIGRCSRPGTSPSLIEPGVVFLGVAIPSGRSGRMTDADAIESALMKRTSR